MNIFYKVKKVHVLGRLQADSSLELKSRLPESLTPAKSETYIGRSPTSNMESFGKIFYAFHLLTILIKKTPLWISD